jgi:hypothetical protein
MPQVVTAPPRADHPGMQASGHSRRLTTPTAGRASTPPDGASARSPIDPPESGFGPPPNEPVATITAWLGPKGRAGRDWAAAASATKE